MSRHAEEERWDVWTVQARNFAKRENYTDAVARLRLVKTSVEEAISDTPDGPTKNRLVQRLARVDELLGSLEARAEAWRTAIATRRQETIDQAEEEMARPLPLAADQR
ncbi:MAG: hypothetical protein AAF436_17075 [Myxococcota bacterium]